MSPRDPHQWHADAAESDDALVSRSQRKRDSTALQALGESLIRLPPSQLAKVPLPDSLREALAEWARISSREGKRRQEQFIGRLMREEGDAAAVAEALENLRVRR